MCLPRWLPGSALPAVATESSCFSTSPSALAVVSETEFSRSHRGELLSLFQSVLKLYLAFLAYFMYVGRILYRLVFFAQY